MSPLPIILYRYDVSPFCHKIDNALVVKKIPHQNVNVSPILPRPEITETLGIIYRRIPILAIGNDVYCDTSLIVSVLERRFPVTEGYGTIFPRAKHGGSADTGLIKAFSKFYADNTLFSPGTMLIRWDKLSAAFIKDRGALRGAPLNVAALSANRNNALSQLSTHLSLIEEQLSDGREWLFDTELPNLADISVHFILAWIKPFKGTETLFDDKKFPHTLKWLAHFSTFLKNRRDEQPAPIMIKGDVAGDLIASSTYEPYSVVGFDSVEGERLAVGRGDVIIVAPDDTGRDYPTSGKLVALNQEELILEVQGSKGIVRCHFPRIGYTVRASPQPKL